VAEEPGEKRGVETCLEQTTVRAIVLEYNTSIWLAFSPAQHHAKCCSPSPTYNNNCLKCKAARGPCKPTSGLPIALARLQINVCVVPSNPPAVEWIRSTSTGQGASSIAIAIGGAWCGRRRRSCRCTSWTTTTRRSCCGTCQYSLRRLRLVFFGTSRRSLRSRATTPLRPPEEASTTAEEEEVPTARRRNRKAAA
jgi:hypothetical protein